MSVCYWVCEGIGIKTSDIIEHLDNKKCIAMLKEQLPNEDIPNEDELDIDDFLHGNPFDNLGDLLCHCDDSETLTYGDNGECEDYLYYAPSYPWDRKQNDPESIQQVHDRIIDAVQKVCNMTKEEIENIIDNDLYEEGWG